MIKKNDILNRTLVGLGILLSFLAVLLLIGTWAINHEPLQGRIRKAVVQRTADSLRFQHLTVSLLPLPHVTMTDAVMSVKGAVRGTVGRARLYPDIMSLFRGDIRLQQVFIEDPNITIDLIDEPQAAAPDDARTGFLETRKEIEEAIATVRSIAPRFRLEVSNGTVTLRLNRSVLTTVYEINGSVALRQKGFDLSLAARGQRWGALSLKGMLLVLKSGIAVRNLSVSGGHSSFSNISGRFIWRKTPFLVIRSGQAIIALDDLYERRALINRLQDRLTGVKAMKGTVRVSEIQFRGRIHYPQTWNLMAAGLVENIIFDSRLFPGPVRVEAGSFTATEHFLTVTGLRGRFLDSFAAGSVGLGGSFGKTDSVNLSFDGTVGPRTLQWAAAVLRMQRVSSIRAPLRLSRVKFAWRKGRFFSLSGQSAFSRGPLVSVEMKWNAEDIRIDRLAVADGRYLAELTFSSRRKQLDIFFRGSLTADTVNRIFSDTYLAEGWVRGDFRARLLLDRPAESTARGSLAASNVVLPRNVGGFPITVRQVDLKADSKTVTMENGSFIWADTPFALNGRISASEEGYQVDMDLNTDTVNVERIREAFKTDEPKNGAGAEPARWQSAAGGRSSLRGIVRVYAANVRFEKYRFSPVTADVLIDRQSVRLRIINANLCGISFAGYLQRLGEKTLLDLQPAALNMPLEPAIECLFRNRRITGSYTLIGKTHAFGKPGKLLGSLQGWVEFTAKDGRIYSLPTLARVFALLNVTELLRGKLPDMGRDGFAYSSITIKGEMQKGKLLLREAALTGATLNLAAAGEIDFGSDRIDVTVLVAPFKTLEYILSKIPLVRNILANRLITVPVRLTGSLSNPDITLLDPQAIGENILEIMRRILELPFLVLNPDRQ